MDPAVTSNFLPSPKGAFHYLTAGPTTGPLMILIHGWPGLALTWRPQILHFASLGYHVVAMDTLGYGQSPAPQGDASLYSCESLVADQLLLLAHLNRPSAIWVGHDWGCGPLWSLASHHPFACTAIISLCVPYRTLELGAQHLITLSNRAIYPPSTYPHAQWDYMIYYERSTSNSVTQFATSSDRVTKLVFSRANLANWMKPSMTSTVIQRSGWFGAPEDVPDIPLAATVLDEPLYDTLAESLRRNGWWSPTAYYLNHSRNAAYNHPSKLAVTGLQADQEPYLDMPVLHIDAIHDLVCSGKQHPGMLKATKRLCRDVRIEEVEAGHWVNLEKADEVNRFMEGFLSEKGLAPSGETEGGTKL